MEDPVSLKFAITVKFELGMSVPEAIFIVVIIGGVVSVDMVFANVIYCISAIFREKSHMEVPVLYVPVYAVAQLAKVLSASVKSMRVPVNPVGTDARG